MPIFKKRTITFDMDYPNSIKFAEDWRRKNPSSPGSSHPMRTELGLVLEEIDLGDGDDRELYGVGAANKDSFFAESTEKDGLFRFDGHFEPIRGRNHRFPVTRKLLRRPGSVTVFLSIFLVSSLIWISSLRIGDEPSHLSTTNAVPQFEIHPRILSGSLMSLSTDGSVMAVAKQVRDPPQDKKEDDVDRVLQVYRLVESDSVKSSESSINGALVSGQGQWEPMGQELDFYHSSHVDPVMDFSEDGTVLALITSSSRSVQVLWFDMEYNEWVPQDLNDQLVGILYMEDGKMHDTRLSANAVSISADGLSLAIHGTSITTEGTTKDHLLVFHRNGRSWIVNGGSLLEEQEEDVDDEAPGQEIDFSVRTIQMSKDGSTIVAFGHEYGGEYPTAMSVLRIYKQQTILDEDRHILAPWRLTWSGMLESPPDQFVGRPSDVSISYDGSIVAVASSSGPKVFSYTEEDFNLNVEKKRTYYGDWKAMDVDSRTNSQFRILSVSLSPSGSGLAVGRVLKDDLTMGTVDYYQLQKSEGFFHWKPVGPKLYDDESELFGSHVSLSSTNQHDSDSMAILAVGATRYQANRVSERSGHGAIYIYSLKYM